MKRSPGDLVSVTRDVPLWHKLGASQNSFLKQDTVALVVQTECGMPQQLSLVLSGGQFGYVLTNALHWETK